MDALVILALAIAVIVCLLPGIMAYSYYFGGTEKTEPKSRKVGMKKHVTVGNV